MCYSIRVSSACIRGCDTNVPGTSRVLGTEKAIIPLRLCFALLWLCECHLFRRSRRINEKTTLAGFPTLPELIISWNTGFGPASILCAFAALREMLCSARSAPLREHILNPTFLLMMRLCRCVALCNDGFGPVSVPKSEKAPNLIDKPVFPKQHNPASFPQKISAFSADSAV